MLHDHVCKKKLGLDARIDYFCQTSMIVSQLLRTFSNSDVYRSPWWSKYEGHYFSTTTPFTVSCILHCLVNVFYLRAFVVQSIVRSWRVGKGAGDLQESSCPDIVSKRLHGAEL